MENNDNKTEITPIQQIVKYTISKEPSKLKNVINKEIASRVMNSIETKRSEIGADLFNR